MRARKWVIYLADNEWNNDTMERLAKEQFAADPTLDVVTVNEHGGWFLSWNRDMVCVGTANDMARLGAEAQAFRRKFDGVDIVGYERRQERFVHRYDSYYPKLAQVA